jgi:lysophospholipase L1-like esterase
MAKPRRGAPPTALAGATPREVTCAAMKRLAPALVLIAALARVAAAAPPVAPTTSAGFHLRPGDTVVFYGDSITDQRLYTTFVETFVVTRFPDLDVRFVHSGWGGDRVSGGGGGGIDLRLHRDVFAYHPTVVTIMLGMNDGRYRPFDEPIFRTYSGGYEQMIRALQHDAPRARITVIQPSPYDEVTRPQMNGGSYNDVMVRYGGFLKQLALRERMTWADLNTDLVDTLKKANASDAANALKIVPDRVHPGPAGHLIMAGSLLKAWHAPAVVSSVDIDGAHAKLLASRNTRVSDLATRDGSVRWTQHDAALPMPIDAADPVIALTLRSSRFVETLNQQPLKVSGLGAGSYALRIDDEQVGVFRGPELAKGINLAMLPTPMAQQAARVHALTIKRANVHNTRWRQIQVPLEEDASTDPAPAIEGLDRVVAELAARQRDEARPRSRHFALVPVNDVAAAVPAGFTPVFGTGDANTLLLSGRRARSLEIYLELSGDGDAEGNLLVRADDRGHGFQVSLEAREGGAFGRIRSVGLAGPAIAINGAPWAEHWKKGGWNSLRVRVEGTTSTHIVVALNGSKLTDFNDGNPASGADPTGLVLLQLPPDAARALKVRNVAVRALP